MNTTARALIVTTGLCAGTPITVAMSQPVADVAATSGALEEIVVTARRREESLQRTPIAVTALSARDIEERSISDVRDVAAYTPNMQFTPGGITGNGGGHAFIRGIGQYDFLITTDPGVGVYVDGVYLGRTQGSLMDLVDVDRIEVLRGPQGTLFGKNTIGGAINVISTKPSEELKGRAEFTTGSFERKDGRISIGFPIVGSQLTARIALLSKSRNGYGRTVDFATGRTLHDLGDEDRVAARGMLQWTPTQSLDVLVTVDGTRVREQKPVQSMVKFVPPDPTDPASLVNLYNFVAVPLFGAPPFDGRYITANPYVSFNTDSPSRNDLDNRGAAATIDWHTGGGTLKSITAYRNLRTYTGTDDSTPATIIDQTDDLHQHQFSQEIQFSATSFAGALNWLAGVMYFKEHAENRTVAQQAPLLNPVFQMLGIPVELGRNDLHVMDIANVAGYAQGSYALTDRWSLTVGARYTHEKKEYTPWFRTLAGAVIIPQQEVSKTWDAVTPRYGLEFQITDDILAYASVARGFRSGGFNGRAANATRLIPFDPEYVSTYELGMKSRWFQERIASRRVVYES